MKKKKSIKYSRVFVIEKAVDRIIYPPNFVTFFETKQEFVDWVNLGSKEDLEAALKEFNKYKLKEYSKIIKNNLKNKVYAKNTD